jgi:transitional endoplasmic reticulum ATPase
MVQITQLNMMLSHLRNPGFCCNCESAFQASSPKLLKPGPVPGFFCPARTRKVCRAFLPGIGRAAQSPALNHASLGNPERRGAASVRPKPATSGCARPAERIGAGHRPPAALQKLGLTEGDVIVTKAMEAEDKQMRGELKKRAAAVQPMGFIAPETLTPTREKKHD